MKQIFACLAGAIFGLGLIISGMANPAKVIGFLDVAGQWDPTLAFVMGGAMIPMFISWALVKKMHKPVIADDFSLPGLLKLDPKLLWGSTIFGIGWGLVGICPGPGLAALTLGNINIVYFVLAMIAGMILFRFIYAPDK